MIDIKKTPLHQMHLEAGAKMIPFAGYDMPVRYTSLIEEHHAVRQSVGVFDVSHMGEFIIAGPDALPLLQRISSNDISKLSVSQALYSCMPNHTGGIVDDLIIYRLDDQQYLLVVNAANIEKDWQWISDANINDATMSNVSEDYALLAVQGPKAAALLQQLTEERLAEIKYYTFVQGELAGVKMIISATGYTGSGGFELYIPADKAIQVWKAIFELESDIRVLPAGLGARDTLRLEMGYCLYGHDIDDTTSPIEAGLGWITKFNHDFINAPALEHEKADGAKRRLCGFVMEDKGIPRQGYEILSTDGKIIGKVTSGTISPTLDLGIGLGYIDVPYHKKETSICIQIRKKQLPAVVTRPPFVKI